MRRGGVGRSVQHGPLASTLRLLRSSLRNESNRALVDVELLKTQHAPVLVAKAESFVAVAVAVNDQVNVNDNGGERERDCGSCE
jgi:hypothetical protein